MTIHHDISLKAFNTFGIDVTTRYLGHIDSENSLISLLGDPMLNQGPLMILGGGSNILFTGDYPGLVLKNDILGRELVKEDPEYVWVRLGAGENWHKIVLWVIDMGWAGIENLSLIPGTVGAAPMQNIGAYGVELTSVFSSLEAIHMKTGALRTFSAADCQFAYRNSIFKNELKDQYMITRVVLRLCKKPQFNVTYGAIKETLETMGVQELSIRHISEAVIRIRQSKLPDPLEIGNAGSFFKNPSVTSEVFNMLKAEYANIQGYPQDNGMVKIPAGWLIEQCNWKGYRRDAIGVHQKQALVLVNYGGGHGKEIHKLSQEIQQSVQRVFGILLTPEVNIV